MAVLCSTAIAVAETYSGTTGDSTRSLDKDEGTPVIICSAAGDGGGVFMEDESESDDTSTGIEDIDVQLSTINADGQAIVITSASQQNAEVYSLNGQVIAKQSVAAGTTTIDIPQGGIYIVALTDGTKAKVLVK